MRHLLQMALYSMIFSVILRIGILGIALLCAPSMLASSQDGDAFHYNRLLGRGINLGNALDGPQEGAWGVTLETDYFRLIKKAGVQFGAHSHPLVGACQHRRSIRHQSGLFSARRLGHWPGVVEEFGGRHQRASL
jgi:hypothetical protein